MKTDAQTRTVLVTGGVGFIGSRLVKMLHAAGWTVRVLDDLSSGSEDSIQPLVTEKRLKLWRGSIDDVHLLDECVADAELIVHLAALVSVQVSIEQPEASFGRNVAGAFEVFNAARRSKNRPPVVYASSAAVYGDTSTSRISESDPVRPLSPYACDKLYMEGLARAFHGAYGLESIGLRLFNVYGRGQKPDSPYSGVITKFVARLQGKREITIFGDGEQTRDFVHVNDVCSAFTLAMQKLLQSERGAISAVCNVGSGQATSINRLYGLLAGLMDDSLPPTHVAEVPGNVRHSCADIRLATKLLGWGPATSLEDGLRELMAARAKI